MTAVNGTRRLTASELSNYPERVRGQTPVSGEGAVAQIIYGRDETEGHKIFEVESGNALYQAWAWCIGPINKIEAVYVNDVNINKVSGVTARHYTGDVNQQPDPTLEGLISGYADTLVFSLPGGDVPLAYSVFRFNSGAISGAPRVRATIQGKLVVDPTAGSGTDPYSDNVAIHVDWTSGGQEQSSNNHTINLEGDASVDSGGLQLTGVEGVSPTTGPAYAWVLGDTSLDVTNQEFTDEWVITSTNAGSSPGSRETIVSATDTGSPGTKIYQIDLIGDSIRLFLSSDGATWDICDDVEVATITSSKTYLTVERNENNELIVYDNGVESYTQELLSGSPLAGESVYQDTSSPSIRWYIGTQNASGQYFVGSIQGWRRTVGIYRYGADHQTTATPFADSDSYSAGTVYSSKPALFWKDLVESTTYGLGGTTDGVTEALTWGDGFLEDGETKRAVGIGVTLAATRRVEEYLDLFAQYARCLSYVEGANYRIQPDQTVQSTDPSGIQNLVSDGTFDGSSPSPWTLGSSWFITSGVLARIFIPSPDTSSSASQTITTEAGVVYAISVEIVDISPTIGSITVEFDGTEVISSQSAAGTYTGFGTASGTSTTLEIIAAAGTTINIDNVSVKRKYFLETRFFPGSLRLHGSSERDTPSSVNLSYTLPGTSGEAWSETNLVVTHPYATAGLLPFIQTSVHLPGIKHEIRASNHAVLKLQQGYRKMDCSYTTRDHAAFHRPGDVVQAKNTNRGVDKNIWIEDVDFEDYGVWNVKGRRNGVIVFDESTSPGMDIEVEYPITDSIVPDFYSATSYLDELKRVVNGGTDGFIGVMDESSASDPVTDASRFGNTMPLFLAGNVGQTSFLDDGRTSTTVGSGSGYRDTSAQYIQLSGTMGCAWNHAGSSDTSLLTTIFSSGDFISLNRTGANEISVTLQASGTTIEPFTVSGTTNDHNYILLYAVSGADYDITLYADFELVGSASGTMGGTFVLSGPDFYISTIGGSGTGRIQYVFSTPQTLTSGQIARLGAAWDRNFSTYIPA